jgi:hypothetical protein
MLAEVDTSTRSESPGAASNRRPQATGAFLSPRTVRPHARGVEIGFEIVVRRHLVDLAALFVEAQ